MDETIIKSARQRLAELRAARASGTTLFKPASYWASLDGETPKRSKNPIRDSVRQNPCPECLASPGEPCIGSRGQERKSNHRARYGRE